MTTPTATAIPTPAPTSTTAAGPIPSAPSPRRGEGWGEGPTSPSPPTAPQPFWLVPALAYAALIFYLSSLSNPLPRLTVHVWDKLLHGTEYAGLAALLTLGIDHVSRMGLRRAATWAVVLASLYGASDEIHQALVPKRSCDLVDWVADTAGALIGAALAALFLRRWRARASIRA